jgi:two-component system response regulator LytT
MKATRVVIVEDEAATARNLSRLLADIDPGISIATTISSVTEAVDWFNEWPDAYDLIFMDIRLADGLSFEIFKRADISKPVIFVTAYNEHALLAFKNNGIDYILKPFDEEELVKAFKKFNNLTGRSAGGVDAGQFNLLLQQINQVAKPHKKSFLVHFRDKLIPVETVRIAWFYTANEIVYAHTIDEHQYIMEFTLEQLEQQLDPSLFFRANRQFVINRNAIAEINFFFNGRLLVKVKPEPSERILISKARVTEFKNWMNT